jgi:hypothetical protein
LCDKPPGKNIAIEKRTKERHVHFKKRKQYHDIGRRRNKNWNTRKNVENVFQQP